MQNLLNLYGNHDSTRWAPPFYYDRKVNFQKKDITYGKRVYDIIYEDELNMSFRGHHETILIKCSNYTFQ